MIERPSNVIDMLTASSKVYMQATIHPAQCDQLVQYIKQLERQTVVERSQINYLKLAINSVVLGIFSMALVLLITK